MIARALTASPSLRIAVVGGVVAAATLAGWIHHAHATPDPARPPAPSVGAAAAPGSVLLSDEQWGTLDIRAVTPASFPTLATVDALVTVDENATVPVYSPATGRVEAVRAQVGQAVRRGEWLATIAGGETSQAAADLAAAAAQARTTAQQLVQARATLARLQAMVEAGSGAAKDLLQARSDLAAAEGAKTTADAALAAAATKAAAVGLEPGAPPGRLVSPLAGMVIQRQAVVGQFVDSLASGAAAPLFTVSDLRHVWVVGSVNQDEAARLRVGQAVDVTTPDGRQPLRAAIAWVSPTVDPQTRRLPFRVELANAGRVLRPQTTARVRVLEAGGAPALAVPAGALVFDGPRAHCFVVTGPRQLTLRAVGTGRTDGGLTEIVSGLRAGDRVVARGAVFVDAMVEDPAS